MPDSRDAASIPSIGTSAQVKTALNISSITAARISVPRSGGSAPRRAGRCVVTVGSPGRVDDALDHSRDPAVPGHRLDGRHRAARLRQPLPGWPSARRARSDGPLGQDVPLEVAAGVQQQPLDQISRQGRGRRPLVMRLMRRRPAARTAPEGRPRRGTARGTGSHGTGPAVRPRSARAAFSASRPIRAVGLDGHHRHAQLPARAAPRRSSPGAGPRRPWSAPRPSAGPAPGPG